MIRLRSCERICVSLQREHNNLCDGSGEQNQTIASSPFQRALLLFYLTLFLLFFCHAKNTSEASVFSGTAKMPTGAFHFSLRRNEMCFADTKTVLCVILSFLGDIAAGLARQAPVATSRLAGLSGELAEEEKTVNLYETKEAIFRTKPLC